MSRATKNWKTLKELEKAIQVYWSAKDRLPPRVPSASHLIISPDSLIFFSLHVLICNFVPRNILTLCEVAVEWYAFAVFC